MDKGIYIREILDNTQIEGLFVIGCANVGTTKNGSFYWSLKLFDRTGSIDAKIWHPLSVNFAQIDAGRIARISGRASRYKDQTQIALDSFYQLSQEEEEVVEKAHFIPVSPKDPESMFADLRALCQEEFKYPPWKKFVSSIFASHEIMTAFRSYPAAKSMHHAYAHGLLEHTLGVTRLCRTICDSYPQLDRPTLIAGAIFHDIGKIYEFSGGFINDYTDEGRLIGHIVLGLNLLEPYLAKSGLDKPLRDHFRHLILSHHGEYEYGASRLPQSPEAFALHYADNLDAKMAQFRNLFAENEGPCWSEYQKGMNRYLYNPLSTPAMTPKNTKSIQEDQCLPLLKE